MSQGDIDPEAFRTFEVAGWEDRADTYGDFFAPITGRVATPLLDAARVGPGSRVLDVGAGPGYVAAQAVTRGASAVGVDVAERMVALAARLHPGITFRQADAERLPFANDSFDAVVGNFVTLHLARPEHAVVEFARVLAPGGKLALTTWDAPARCPLLGVFVEAVQVAGAVHPPDVPPGPPQFRFADDGEFVALLRSTRLEEVEVHTVRFTHRVTSAHELWEGLLRAAVRITALIRGQSEEMQRRIRAEFERLVRLYVVDGVLVLPVSVKLAAGRKAAGYAESPRNR